MSYAIRFFAIAGSTSALAIIHGGYWHFLHWFSISFSLLALGHWRLGYIILGKQADGCLPLWSKFIHLPYLLFSSITWFLLCAATREDAFNYVDEDLIIGRRLKEKEFPKDIANCIDLTCEFEEPPGIIKNTNYISVPTLDANVPDVTAMNRAFDRLREGTTYIHCAQGHGRTGVAAILLLARQKKAATFEEGLRLLQQARPGVSLNSKQRQFVIQQLEQARA